MCRIAIKIELSSLFLCHKTERREMNQKNIEQRAINPVD